VTRSADTIGGDDAPATTVQLRRQVETNEPEPGPVASCARRVEGWLAFDSERCLPPATVLRVSYDLYFWPTGVAVEPGPLADELAEEDADGLAADERVLAFRAELLRRWPELTTISTRQRSPAHWTRRTMSQPTTGSSTRWSESRR